MERNEKKSLFTAVSEEESATVCGGITLTNAVYSLIGPDGASLSSPTTQGAFLSSGGYLHLQLAGLTLTADLTLGI